MKTHMPRVLVAAALVFAGAAWAGWLAGHGLLVLAFLSAFAAACYALDAEVRAFFRKGPGTSPAATPAAPSSARTSARGWGAARARAAD